MSESPGPRPVPPGTRVLQIGPFKTGTTAIQHAASSRRATLAAHGVGYPGTGLNHRWGCSALLDLTWGWARAEAGSADRRRGPQLLKEIDRAPRGTRIWISYERLAVLSTAKARSLCDQIGEPLHVVVGLRPLRSLLASEWQQMAKSGRRPGPLTEWAQKSLDAIEEGRPTARHLDHGGLVERWARIVGADAVTCILVDRGHPDVLPRTVEGLFGLPRGLLDPVPSASDGATRNRSLTAPELALVGAVARELRNQGLTREDYLELVGQGVIPRLLARRPDPAEARVRLDEESVRRARGLDQRAAQRVRRSGVQVFGDLDQYADGAAPERAHDGTGQFEVPDRIPVEIAAAAVLGATEQLRIARDHAATEPVARIIRHRLVRAGRRLLARLRGGG